MIFRSLIFLISLNLHAAAQVISDLNAETDLDTAEGSEWLVTTDAVAPGSPGKNGGLRWIRAEVPGNLAKIPELWTEEYRAYREKGSHFTDYWKATLALHPLQSLHPPFDTAWYRKEIILPKKITQAVGLRLGQISDRDEVYFNGSRIGGHGIFYSDYPQSYDRIRLYEVPEHLLLRGKTNVILIRVQGYFEGEMGILADQTSIGPLQPMLKSLQHSEYIKIILLISYFTAALYFLFLFIRRPEEKEYLNFAIAVICLVVYQFLRNQLKYDTGLSLDFMKKIEFLLITVIFPGFIHFIRVFFRYRYNIFNKIVDGIFAVDLLFILIHPSCHIWDFLTLENFQILWSAYIGLGLYYLLVKTFGKNREKDALYMLAGFTVVFICTVIDILSTNLIINVPRMVGYGLMALILGLAGTLANRFVRMHFHIEDLNLNLEKKVEQRTEELHDSLKRVEALKEQQDGDYYLTSLLIKPLAVNRVETDNLNLEFFLLQKKKFIFRKWDTEIGGDLCVAHIIRLNGRDYTAFINGDAMGKSIQGAGGAIVLGVIFNSIIARTQSMEELQKQTPEQWLKKCFLELQSIFLNFDGSMLVSVVTGLIDNENGFLYFFNAEHPWTVLYRDGKAEFLEYENHLRKIGVDIPGSEFRITTFPLQQGDMVFLGSDGRDDLLLDHTEEGSRIINNDEHFFLRHIETGRGEIPGIFENIKAAGELTDDLSIIKVTFLKDISGLGSDPAGEKRFREAEELKRKGRIAEADQVFAEIAASGSGIPAMMSRIRLHASRGDFKAAAEAASDACRLYPWEFLFFRLACICHSNAGNFRDAADFGESLLMRKGDDREILPLLYMNYARYGNRRKDEILNQLAVIDPAAAERISARPVEALPLPF